MIKVYKYGALAPSDVALVLAQMRLGHEYYNALVEKERARRQRYHDQATEEGLEGEDWRNCRVDLFKEDKEKRLRETRETRAEFSTRGLYWGTYLLIERAFDQACKKSLFPWKPKFRRWADSSKLIGVQVQKDKQADRYYQLTGEGKYQTLSIRIRSDKGRPVFVSIPVKIHRPMAGTVTWVSIHLSRVADRMVWHVCFTVETPEEVWMEGLGTVAVDIGWRVRPDDTIRMAYCVDDRGRHREILSPDAMRIRLRRSEEMAALRANRLNSLWAERRGDLSVLGVNRQPLSVRHLRSQLRGEKDGLEIEDLPDWLRAWLARDLREWRREANVRRRAIAARRDAIRNFVTDLRRTYDTVLVEDSNWKEIKEEKEALPRPARRNEFAAAPGEIADGLKALPGTMVVPAEFTTLDCCVCGHTNEPNPKLLVTCEQCGDTRDQDERACINMLKLHAEGKSKSPKARTARKRTSRFAKKEVIEHVV